MNRLILLRHGEAERQSASGADFDRRLAPAGVRETAAMGETLADLGLCPDVVLVSTAARTRDTWAALSSAFPDAEVRFEDELYHADTPTVRRLAEAARPSGVVMVVGHNPGLQDLAVRLLSEGSAAPSLIDRCRSGFPTASAAVFLVDDHGRHNYDGLFFPRDRRDR